MATVIEPPCERPLHRPAPWDHLEALPFLMSHRLSVDFVGVLQAAPPCVEPLGRLGAIDPDLAQPLDAIGNIRGQQLDQA